MITPKFKKVPLNSRISEDIYELFIETKTITKLDSRELIEISLLTFIQLLKKSDYNLDGIDLIQLAKTKRQRFLREMRGIFRAELLSKETFISRVRKDLLLLLKNKSTLDNIKKLIHYRKAEALLYDNAEELQTELNLYLQIDEKDYNKIINFIEKEKFKDIIIHKHKHKIVSKLKNGN